MLVYDVRPGDTLEGIAQRYGVSTAQLQELNGLPGPNLVPGQALLIPTRRITVLRGQSLYEIARRTGISVSRLVAANRIQDPAALQPGRPLYLPPPPRERKEVIGYLPVIDPNVGPDDVAVWRRQLTWVAVFAYLVDAQGNLTPPPKEEAALAAIRAQGAQPLASIANIEPGGAFNREVAHSLLNDPAARSRAAQALAQAVREKGYAGADVDIEAVPREDRQELVSFIREIREAVRPAGGVVNVAVPPKYDEERFAYAAGHDYAGIGQVADRVTIMNYEFHWVGGPPGPIAPYPEISRVVAYATRLIPAEKVLMGISTLSYDWPLPDTPENRATARSHAEAVALAVAEQVPIQYNESAESPWYRYTTDQGQRREVWFEDARSLMEKLLLVREAGLRGVGIWQLGSSSPQYPALLEYLFRVP